MRKIVIAVSAIFCLVFAGAALAADDGATLYQTHCQSCHGPDGSRAPGPGITPIGGQSSADLMKMLNGYKDGSFGGQRKQVMEGVVKQLSDDQLKTVSDHVSKM